MAATTILDIWNRKILSANGVQRVEAHQHAKYSLNLSSGCKDIKIFQFFKMAVTAILDFQIWEISLADGVRRSQTHHGTKFRRNRAFFCGDIAIFRFLKKAAAAILDCRIRKILVADGVWRAQSKLVVPLWRYCDFSNFQDGRRRHFGFLKLWNFIGYWVQRIETHLHAKFRQNWSISCEDIQIIPFFKMAAICHLEFVWGIFGPPQWVLGVLSLCKIWLWSMQ